LARWVLRLFQGSQFQSQSRGKKERKNQMNPLIQFKKATSLFLVALGLGGVVLLPKAKALNPTPDGGYAGGNTAEGQQALSALPPVFTTALLASIHS